MEYSAKDYPPPTEAEAAAMDELRTALGKLEPDEGEVDQHGNSLEELKAYAEDTVLLLRFIRARPTVKESETIFREMVCWRREYRPEDVTLEDCKEQMGTGVAFWCGEDMLGRPILVIRGERHVVGKFSLEDSFRFTVYLIEEGIRRMKTNGVAQYVIIMDRENYGRKNFDLPWVKAVAGLQNHYAELFARGYILPVNKLFHVLFKVCKVFWDKHTVEKIVLLGKDYSAALSKDVAPEHLLEKYGGVIKESEAMYGPSPNENDL